MSADRSVTYRNKKLSIDGRYGCHLYTFLFYLETVEIEHEEMFFSTCWSPKIGKKLGGGGLLNRANTVGIAEPCTCVYRVLLAKS